jgi:hypothetical protein
LRQELAFLLSMAYSHPDHHSRYSNA